MKTFNIYKHPTEGLEAVKGYKQVGTVQAEAPEAALAQSTKLA
jgi:hypothetical protein